MKKIMFITCATLLLLACASSVKVLHSWTPPNRPTKKFKEIMVLVLAPQKYNDAGRIGEEAMVNQLKANGVNAVSAQALYGPERFRNDNEDIAMAKMRRSGADGVLVTSLLNVHKEHRYVPGYWTPPPYYGQFWGYYSYWWGRAYWGYDPGYYETTRKYIFETNLYDLATSNLLYSVQSQAVDPASTQDVANTFAIKLVQDMKAKGVL